jgi:MerR family transcriptional regulator/heat shock protein HspR
MKSDIKFGDPVYTLGVASKLSGVATHSIRQYIDKGLLLPFITDTKRHLFSEIDIQRLKIIKKYIDEGLNIAGIKTLYAQIPGFLINSCNEKQCNTCDGFFSSHLPCWIANKDKVKCGQKECRDCDVYKMADPVEDLKKFFLILKKN